MAYGKPELIKLINEHGYLLQEAVENLITVSSGSGRFKWKTLSSEHFWKHKETGQEGYADLLIESEDMTTVGIIECKRVKDVTPWIFLCPYMDTPAEDQSKVFWIYRGKQHNYGSGWLRARHEPSSFRAKFCIVKGQDQQKPMLERTAGNLLLGVEAIGQQYLQLTNLKGADALLFLPIIVTNADLYICNFDPKNIDLGAGTLDESNAEVKPVPYVRFEKVMTESSINGDSIQRFDEIAHLQSQTVLVINAKHLHSFLFNCRSLSPVNFNLYWNQGTYPTYS